MSKEIEKKPETKQVSIAQIVSQLSAPFDDKDIQWRIQSGGLNKNGKLYALLIPYIDARAVMNRLDSLLGPYNWQTRLEVTPDYVKCSLSICINGQWITKEDVGTPSQADPIKGATSDSLKRAAVHWGIGRHLYESEPKFADILERPQQGAIQGRVKDKSGKMHFFYYKKPTL